MNESEAAKFLILGAGGQIGSAFQVGIKLRRSDLDVTDSRELRKKICEIKPSAVIHLANLDIRHCEQDPFLALKTNVHATQYLLAVASDLSIPVVFISSSCIFNGEKGGSFDETAKPEPLNFYAEAKVISENILLNEYAAGTIVVRTGWVFGGHGAHHPKFVDVAIEKCKKNEPLFAGQDNDGSPTYVKDLVAEITKLVLSGKRGLFHVANAGAATPWDIAEFIRSEFESDSAIEPLKLSALDQKIRRSKCEVLTSKYIKLRSWHEAMREYVQSKRAKV